MFKIQSILVLCIQLQLDNPVNPDKLPSPPPQPGSIIVNVIIPYYDFLLCYILVGILYVGHLIACTNFYNLFLHLVE